jgi:uncharacterized protein YkwD
MFKLSRHLAAAAALAWSVAVPAAPAAEPSGADAGNDYAARVLQTLNAYREERGLPPLLMSPDLTALAALHSQDMAARKRLSHDGFPRRFGQTVGELCVENVAQGFRIPEQVLVGWRRVPTHHRNVLEKRVRYAGVAASGLYVTYFACDTAR